MAIRVLELRSVWGTGGGPDKTILSGAALKSTSGVETIVCYIRDARDTVFTLDRRARNLGIEYEEIVERSSFDRSIWPALRTLLRRRRIDIVHAHDYKTDLLTLALSRFEPIVPLATAHGFVGSGPTERYVYYPLDRRLLAWYPRVIAVSNTVRDELVRAGASADRITVILNGIDHRVFVRERRRESEVRRELGFSADDLVIGAVGRLDYEKRYDLLIEAFADVRRTHPAAQLAIAGDGKHRPELEATIERFGLQSSCRLLGLQRDVGRLHHAFDLFVQSSIREGTPNAVLEAMALETPIVATDSGGTAELVEHEVHGLIVPCGSAGALRDTMLRVLREPEATCERARAARRRVESELSFARRMERVESVYHDLMAGRLAQQRAS
jgi:glycosyltransferase involved in cell wall biosynthesis